MEEILQAIHNITPQSTLKSNETELNPETSTEGLEPGAETEEFLENIRSRVERLGCKLNILSQSDGSAMFSLGSTVALVGVRGPIEAPSKSFNSTKAIVDCVYRPKVGLPNEEDRYIESLIQDACESMIIASMYPRSMFSISVQHMDGKCGLEACMINAASMALIIAGAPMDYVLIAAHCIVNKNKCIVLNPNSQEMEGHLASLTFAYESNNFEIVSAHNEGYFNTQQFRLAELVCRSGCKVIYEYFKKVLKEFYKTYCHDLKYKHIPVEKVKRRKKPDVKVKSEPMDLPDEIVPTELALDSVQEIKFESLNLEEPPKPQGAKGKSKKKANKGKGK